MGFFLSMLPVYLFGNVHCLGMCGPLVMMISKHQYKYYYFIGRILSFTLAGILSGALGSVFGIILKEYYISAIFSFLFGFIILTIAFDYLFGINFNLFQPILKKLAPINKQISILMLKDTPFSTFLFGCATILLPCGQTILVYSACALYCDFSTGLINGFMFALLTSPSLYFSMQAFNLFTFAQKYYQKIMGLISLFIGSVSIFRALADIDYIPHFVIQLSSIEEFHLVLF